MQEALACRWQAQDNGQRLARLGLTSMYLRATVLYRGLQAPPYVTWATLLLPPCPSSLGCTKLPCKHGHVSTIPRNTASLAAQALLCDPLQAQATELPGMSAYAGLPSCLQVIKAMCNKQVLLLGPPCCTRREHFATPHQRAARDHGVCAIQNDAASGSAHTTGPVQLSCSTPAHAHCQYLQCFHRLQSSTEATTTCCTLATHAPKLA